MVTINSQVICENFKRCPNWGPYANFGFANTKINSKYYNNNDAIFIFKVNESKIIQ